MIGREALDRALSAVSLRRAFEQLRERHHIYEPAPGLQQRLERLGRIASSPDYQPRPYRAKEIVDLRGKPRKVRVAQFPDAVIQRALQRELCTELVPYTHEHSTAYRPKVSAEDAAWTLSCASRGAFPWVMHLDVVKAFDSVRHDVLFSQLERLIESDQLLRVIRASVACSTVEKGVVIPTTAGVSMGTPLSGVIFNLHLSEVDDLCDRLGVVVVRYSDNIALAGKTKGQVENATRELKAYLKDVLGLDTHLLLPDPVNIEQEPIEFLAYEISNRGIGISRDREQWLWTRVFDGVEYYLKHPSSVPPLERTSNLCRSLAKYHRLAHRKEFFRNLFRCASFSLGARTFGPHSSCGAENEEQERFLGAGNAAHPHLQEDSGEAIGSCSLTASAVDASTALARTMAFQQGAQHPAPVAPPGADMVPKTYWNVQKTVAQRLRFLVWPEESRFIEFCLGAIAHKARGNVMSWWLELGCFHSVGAAHAYEQNGEIFQTLRGLKQRFDMDITPYDAREMSHRLRRRVGLEYCRRFPSTSWGSRKTQKQHIAFGLHPDQHQHVIAVLDAYGDLFDTKDRAWQLQLALLRYLIDKVNVHRDFFSILMKTVQRVYGVALVARHVERGSFHWGEWLLRENRISSPI